MGITCRCPARTGNMVRVSPAHFIFSSRRLAQEDNMHFILPVASSACHGTISREICQMFSGLCMSPKRFINQWTAPTPPPYDAYIPTVDLQQYTFLCIRNPRANAVLFVACFGSTGTFIFNHSFSSMSLMVCRVSLSPSAKYFLQT